MDSTLLHLFHIKNLPVVQGHNYSLAITRRLLVKHLQDVLKSHQPILEKRNRFMMTKTVSWFTPLVILLIGLFF